MFFYEIEFLWVRGPFCGQSRNNLFASHATMFCLLRNMQYAVLFLLQEWWNDVMFEQGHVAMLSCYRRIMLQCCLVTGESCCNVVITIIVIGVIQFTISVRGRQDLDFFLKKKLSLLASPNTEGDLNTGHSKTGNIRKPKTFENQKHSKTRHFKDGFQMVIDKMAAIFVNYHSKTRHFSPVFEWF